MKLRHFMALAGALPAMAASATAYDLTLLSGSAATALDINNLGQIVGQAQAGGFAAPVLWSSAAAAPQVLSLPAGFLGQGRATAINDQGIVYGSGIAGFGQGYSGVSGYSFYPEAAVTWSQGLPQALGPTGPVAARVTDVNAQGLAVGYNVTDRRGGAQAYAWSAGSALVLAGTGVDTVQAQGVNAAGTIVGRAYDSSGTSGGYGERAVMWTDAHSAPTEIAGLLSADAINDRGQILGRTETGLVIVDGTQRNAIPVVGWGLDINQQGSVLGSTVQGTHVSSFVWSGGQLVMLDDALSAEQRAAGWTLQGAALNDAGQVVGTLTDPAANAYAVLLTPSAIPEPASAWMAALGAAVCLLIGGRRRACPPGVLAA